ncbi:antibiotic ABC transporter ATP-binding protein [Bacillus pumilus]|uniref:Antibiotic ABC transporter ATP-binding protein n=1 Tax=Bacillus pumilus TaxID=1408 RepID=A0A2A5IJ51_BACPU|nr:ABC transporter ATP-binding protein [Bacillus pumilus]PCK17434.1 antibiotic ABC transporter ATP-binding protein [Bacillus pumilus]
MKKNHLFELLRIVNWPRKIIFFSILLSIFAAVINLIIPIITKNVIDDFSIENINWYWIILLVVFFIFNACLSGISFYMLKYLGENAIYSIKKAMWNKILRLRIAYFDKNESGTTISRLTDDVDILNDFIAEKLPNLLSQIVIIVGSVVMLFVLDWKLTLAMLTIIPVTFFIILPIGNLTYKISLKLQDEIAEYSGLLGRVLTEIRLVKSYSAEDGEYYNGEKKLKELLKLRLKEAKIQAIVSPIVTGTMVIILIVIIGYGGLRVSSGDISAGSFVAIIFYLIQSVTPLTSLSSFYTDYKKAMGSTERLYEIYSSPEEDVNENTLDIQHERNTSLSIKELNFSYDNNVEVLKNINFDITKNKTTAIVGPSGSGKSTLFYLIERMYEPTSGNILYGEESIYNFSLQEWRNTIGYVMQDSSMMNGTIKGNLIYGLDKDMAKAELEQYARLANAHEFIVKLPEGYDTMVGERGVKLSGGQRQRIAIGRAFLRNPKLLLLDEATSNLDSESEQLVQDALNNLMRSRTTLVIAHRLSTIKNADQIIFLDNGEITGIGTHEELLCSHRKYTLFVETQELKQNQNFKKAYQ